MSYTLSSSTKQTSISISVPRGGYFTISNNCQDSPGTLLFNVFDFLLLSADLALDAPLDFASGDAKITVFQDIMKDEIFSLDEFALKEFIKAVKSYALNVVDAESKYQLSKKMGVAVCGIEDVMKRFDIDLNTAMQTAFSVGESAFNKLTGPFGATLSALFESAKYGDAIVQAIDLAYSEDNPYVVIYATTSPLTEVTIDDVTVQADEGVITDDMTPQVFKVKFGDNVPELDDLAVPDGQYETYNIRFMKNGVATQPNGEVAVKISIPDGYKRDKCVVLRQEADGSWTQLDATIEGDIISFKTTHFSLYAIVDTRSMAANVTLSEDTITLTPGDSHQLDCLITPQDASQMSLIWQSSNPTVASVDETGRVSAFSAGTSTISVTTGDGSHTVNCKVIVTKNTQQSSTAFTDVIPSTYYYDAVRWAVNQGITTGTGDGTTFSPDLVCTRAQIATFLWRAAGSPVPKGSGAAFTDVRSNTYYYDAVLWAVENGITKGTGNGSMFSPDMACSRAQIATFLWRAARSPAPKSTANPFTDVRSDAYYYKAVQWAVENSITLGTNEAGTAFSPDADCTRAQIVTFLYRAYN